MNKNEDKTVLMVPFGIVLSIVSRLLEIAKRLRDLGYPVLFAGQGKPMRFVQEAGFKVYPLIEYDSDKFVPGTKRGLLRLYCKESVERFVQEEVALMREVKPTLVLGDLRPSLGISAPLAGVPYAALTPSHWTPYRTSAPRMLPGPLCRVAAPFISLIFDKLMARPFDAVSRKYGLPAKERFSAYNQSETMTLLPELPEFATTQNRPAHVHYVGPVLWEPDGPLADWIDTLDPSQPVIYCTMGKTANRQFFAKMARWLDGTAYQVIITTGGLIDPDEVRALSPNFYVEEFLPGSKVMARSDLVICHGGNCTTYHAVANGMPVIVMPLTPDQRYNADRLVELGIGLSLEGRKVLGLREAVEEVLGNPRYRTSARRWKIIVTNHDGAKTTARLIVQHLAERERVVAPARELAPRIFPVPKRWATQLASFASAFVKRDELSEEDEAAIGGKMVDSDE